MNQPERFNYVGEDAEMVAEPDGGYVLYADYEALRASVQQPASPTILDADNPYRLEMLVGTGWEAFRSAAERIVARIADNDCLTCKHWSADAVYAVAVELALYAATLESLNSNPVSAGGTGQFNVLTPEQEASTTISDLAYWTWRKLSNLNFANISGEIEAAINHALRAFSAGGAGEGEQPSPCAATGHDWYHADRDTLNCYNCDATQPDAAPASEVAGGEEKLLPCPFCGVIPIRRDCVYRYGSIAEHPEGAHCPIENTTIGIRGWNTRATPSPADVEKQAREKNMGTSKITFHMPRKLPGRFYHAECISGHVFNHVDELDDEAFDRGSCPGKRGHDRCGATLTVQYLVTTALQSTVVASGETGE